MRVVLFTGVFSSFKEKNRLISKEMRVVLFDVFRRCSLFSSIKEIDR